jgi:hypothetical protein
MGQEQAFDIVRAFASAERYYDTHIRNKQKSDPAPAQNDELAISAERQRHGDGGY